MLVAEMQSSNGINYEKKKRTVRLSTTALKLRRQSAETAIKDNVNGWHHNISGKTLKNENISIQNCH